jgi:hypothetical protein
MAAVVIIVRLVDGQDVGLRGGIQRRAAIAAGEGRNT